MALELKTSKDKIKDLNNLIKEYVSKFRDDFSISSIIDTEILDYKVFTELRALTSLDSYLINNKYRFNYEWGLILFQVMKKIKQDNLTPNVESVIQVIKSIVNDTNLNEFVLYQPLKINIDAFDNKLLKHIKELFEIEIIKKLPQDDLNKINLKKTGQYNFLDNYTCFAKIIVKAKTSDYFYELANSKIDAFLGFLMFANQNRLIRKVTMGQENHYVNSRDLFNQKLWYYVVNEKPFYPHNIFGNQGNSVLDYKFSNTFMNDLKRYLNLIKTIKDKNLSKGNYIKKVIDVFGKYWISVTDQSSATSFLKLWIMIETILDTVNVNKEWLMKILGPDKVLYDYLRKKRNSMVHNSKFEISTFERDFMHFVAVRVINIYLDFSSKIESVHELTIHFNYIYADEKRINNTKKVMDRILDWYKQEDEEKVIRSDKNEDNK